MPWCQLNRSRGFAATPEVCAITKASHQCCCNQRTNTSQLLETLRIGVFLSDHVDLTNQLGHALIQSKQLRLQAVQQRTESIRQLVLGILEPVR